MPSIPQRERKKEQNRKAQRLHRSRKLAYIQRLESELQIVRDRYLELHSQVQENFSNEPECPDEEVVTAVKFILHLERVCQGHLEPLDVAGHNCRRLDQIDGHSLLISWKRLVLPVGQANTTLPIMVKSDTAMMKPMNDLYKPNPYDLKQIDGDLRISLQALIDLCSKLPLQHDEMTPVMVWSYLTQHPNFLSFNLNWLKEFLAAKAQCHGYGAVISKELVDESLELALKY